MFSVHVLPRSCGGCPANRRVACAGVSGTDTIAGLIIARDFYGEGKGTVSSTSFSLVARGDDDDDVLSWSWYPHSTCCTVVG